MRAIRQLDPADGEAAGPTSAASGGEAGGWSLAAGVTFGSGAILAVMGLALSLFAWAANLRHGAVPPTAADIAYLEEQVDSLSAVELCDMWHFLAEEGLSSIEEERVVVQNNSAFFQTLSLLGWILAGSGSLVAVATWIIGRR